MLKTTNRKPMLWTLVAAIAAAVVAVYAYLQLVEPVGRSRLSGPLEKVTLMASVQPALAPFYVALEKGYFRRERLEVNLVPTTSGKAGLVSVIDGKADFVSAAEIPLVLAAMGKKPFTIVATFYIGGKDHGVVARKNRDIARPADLKGKRIGVTPGTTSPFLLDLVLTDSGIRRDEVQLVDLRPEQMPEAMAKGELDAAATWDPTLRTLQRELGSNAITFDGHGLFSYNFVLAANRDFATSRPETVKRFLRALVEANAFIRTHSDEAQRITVEKSGLDAALVREQLNGLAFRLTLDQSLVIALDDAARWAIRNKLTDAAEVPNFLNYITADPLHSLDAAAVSLVR